MDSDAKDKIAKAFKKVEGKSSGLNAAEIAKRVKKYGYNEVPERRENPLLKFVKKFYGPIPFMLEAVVIISYLIGHYRDMYITSALLVFNGIVSFTMERKADNSLELLKERLTINARVLRSGKWVIKKAREIVPGDIIRVRMGDIVPADSVIVSDSQIEVDQSVLTGESMPVSKRASDKIFSGSMIREGEAECLVVAIGVDTYYGKTTQLVQEARAPMHLERTILGITGYLIAIDAIVAVAIFAFGTLALKMGIMSLLPFVLVVIIASVPVALPAAFTVTMALGTERLIDKSILVTNLSAVEEISTLDVICLDKTGTITENILQVKEVFPLGGSTEEEVIRDAVLASNESDKDPIDMAIINYGRERSISTEGYEVLEFTPFKPATKMSSGKVRKGNSESIEVIKGAISAVEGICNLDNAERQEASEKVKSFSVKQYRTIAVARKRENGESTLIGVIALYDKPRKDAKTFIGDMRALGIRPIMITGDNIEVARSIAVEVGIGGNIVDINALKGMGAEEMAKTIGASDGFAGIFPEDKYMIVKALQAGGFRVGMTGDGINDAPALKQAEVGIAVENATDVAKSVAGMVLMKNGLETIVSAVKESRKIFERMITYTIVKITKVIQILFYVAIVFIALKTIPIRPFELILLIFTNDIVNITIATDNTHYSKSPDTWDTKSLIYSSVPLGIFLLLISLSFVPVAEYFALGIAAFQAFTFLLFNFTDNLLIYSIRNRDVSRRVMPSRWLVFSSAISILFAATISYYGILVAKVPLAMMVYLIAAGIAMMAIFNLAKRLILKNLHTGAAGAVG